MRNRLLTMLIIGLIGASLVAAIAWRPKSKYVFGGIWAGYDPANPDTAIFYTHNSQDDMVGRRKTNLLQMGLAVEYSGGFPSGLHSRQQQSDQDADDRDYHQQLDQGESEASKRAHG